MGGCNFEQFQRGSDLKEAFSKAHDAAAWEHGHGGYSGSLAEKPGAVLRSNSVYTLAEAQEFAQRDYRDNDKWGDAYAVRVSDPKIGDGFLFYGWASS